MLKALGFKREDVYIANVLKCRPPGNRDPKPEEALQCRGYLERQIELVSPALILAVGRIAAQNLLATDTALARLRGKVHALGARRWPLVVTYHPAYLLRSPGEKRKAWQDLLFARQTFRRIEAGERCCRERRSRRRPPRPAAPGALPRHVAGRPAGRGGRRARLVRVPVERGHLPRLPARRATCAAWPTSTARSSPTASWRWVPARPTSSTSACAGDLRGRGVGRQMLALLLERSRQAGMESVFLEVRPSNPHAIALYQSVGFVQVGLRKAYYQAEAGARTRWC